MLLDLNEFKRVNDTLGHAAGDQVLQAVAARLVEAAGAGNTVARIGGDEFAILLPNGREAESRQVAGRIVERLQEAILTDRGPIPASASVGVALYPTDASTYDALLEHADATMYEIKRAAGGQI
jgi:diguanylate cyclase (GGDEF)-like protein